MCGSIIRTVCWTDTQPETWLLQLHFAGSLQYETCHLHIPPQAVQTVIEAFLSSAAVRLTCLWELLCILVCDRSQATFHAPWWDLGNQDSLYQSFLNLGFFLQCFYSFPFILFTATLHPSAHPSQTCLFFSFPASTILAWGTVQCVAVCSLQVLFMALFLFKLNQASMEPLEPFQFTTWTQQDGKSNANIKV